MQYERNYDKGRILKERNAVYEPDAAAGGDDVCKGQDADTAVMAEETGS